MVVVQEVAWLTTELKNPGSNLHLKLGLFFLLSFPSLVEVLQRGASLFLWRKLKHGLAVLLEVK